MTEDLKSNAAAMFRDLGHLISHENRSLTPAELEQVNSTLNTLRIGQRTSFYLEPPLREGIALIHDHFRGTFGLPTGADYSALLEYARDRKYFAGLNPSWDSREPADVEFMTFGQLGVYDYALYGSPN